MVLVGVLDLADLIRIHDSLLLDLEEEGEEDSETISAVGVIGSFPLTEADGMPEEMDSEVVEVEVVVVVLRGVSHGHDKIIRIEMEIMKNSSVIMCCN